MEDESSCEDIDECLLFGSCSQSSLCKNKDGGHDCSCMDGYKMINGSCLTERGEPVLIFSTIKEIRAMSVRNHIYTLVDTNLPHAVGVGFDHIDTRVYWTDAAGGKETIMSKKLKSDEADSLVLSGLDMPEQLAIDEYNKNIYFTEAHWCLFPVREGMFHLGKKLGETSRHCYSRQNQQLFGSISMVPTELIWSRMALNGQMVWQWTRWKTEFIGPTVSWTRLKLS